MSTATSSIALDGLLAVEDPDTGKLTVRERIRSVGDAHTIYSTMREADRLSSVNRVQYQAVLDGMPPYDPGRLASLGRGYQANVNFGFMEEALSIAQAPFDDLIDEEVILTTPTRYGDDQQNGEWSQIIAEEITKTITQEDGFEFNYPNMVRQFLFHGASIPYFPDDIGFQWETAHVGDCLLPRNVQAKASAIEVICFVKPYLANELYKHIQNPKIAAEEGWDVSETIQQIKQASSDDTTFWDVERFERDWKDNDITMSARSKVIRAVHMLVTGLGGEISHYIFAEDGKGGNFMYKKLNRFKNQAEAYTIMTYGVGTNGQFHGIRGLGYSLFEPIKQLNMLWSSLLDTIRMSAKLIIQPKTNEGINQLSTVDFGGTSVVLPPDVNIVPWSYPSLQGSIIPGLQMVTDVVKRKAGRYTGESDISQDREQTRAEILAKVDQIASISTSQLRIFKRGMTRLCREQVRRIKRKDWTEHDRNGRSVLQFYARCRLRGVPKEAIHAIKLDGVEFVLPLGNGSAAARTSILERLKESFPFMDEVGKNSYLRDVTRAVAGTTAANSYFPKIAGQRPPIDLDIAVTENSIFDLGGDKQVVFNEIHSVHIPVHLDLMLQIITEFEAMQIAEEDAIPRLRKLHAHTEAHLLYLSTEYPGAPQWRQALQQTNEVIVNGERSLEKKMRDQEQQAMAESQGQTFSPEQEVAEIGIARGIQVDQAKKSLQVALMEQDLAAKGNEEMRRQELHQDRLASSAQKRVLNDVTTAQRLRQQRQRAI